MVCAVRVMGVDLAVGTLPKIGLRSGGRRGHRKAGLGERARLKIAHPTVYHRCPNRFFNFRDMKNMIALKTCMLHN